MSEPLNPSPEREATPREKLQELDVESISDLIAESPHAFLPSHDNPDQTTVELFQVLQNDPSFRVLGYVDHGKPVSYIVALSHKTPGTSSIGPMYVAYSHHGRGLGKRQVRDFIDDAKAHDYTSVFTKTWAENAGARHVFESLGFEIEKVKENDRANGDSTLSYRLHL